MLIVFRHIFYYELVSLWRRANEWLYPIAFFIMVISLFPLAISPDPQFLLKVIPGAIWIAALFAIMISVQTIFQADIEDGALEQTLLTNVPVSLFIISKLAAHWICTCLPLILLTPVLGYLFQLPWAATSLLCLGLLLGTPVLLLLGSFAVALTLGLRQQGMMLSLLVLPLAAPILIFGVNMVLQKMAGFHVEGPLALLAGLFVIALLFMPLATAAALRISLDD